MELGLTIDPKQKVGLVSMGTTLGKMEKYDEALKYLDQAIKLEPDDMHPLFSKVIILAKQNKFARALRIVKKIVRKDPSLKTFLRDEPELAKMQNYESFKELTK